MVFAVFGVVVTAQQSQNQDRDQQKSQISNNVNSVHRNIVQQVSTTTSSKSSTSKTNQTNPVVNKTNTTTGPVVVVSNQTSNQTNNQTHGPIVNNTTVPGNVTNQTDINAALRNAFNRLLAPVLSDAESVRANPTQQSIDKLLNDVESVLDKIGELSIRINISV